MTAPLLTQAEIDAYHADGYLAPLSAFSPAQVQDWRRKLEAFEAGVPAAVADRRKYGRKLHVRLPWARDVIEDPRILDRIAQLIGPDILCYQSTFFIKEAQSPAIAAWHQDATFFGLDPHEHVTAWVALSDASVEAGCMRFLPGSHRRGQLRHESDSVTASVNGGSQMIREALDESHAVSAPLTPGQMSLHHTLIVHNSAPNRTDDRRIGFGISYVPTRVRHNGSQRIGATLVRGIDRFGHFDLEPDPRRLPEAERETAHDRSYAAYRRGYDEQIARHASARA